MELQGRIIRVPSSGQGPTPPSPIPLFPWGEVGCRPNCVQAETSVRRPRTTDQVHGAVEENGTPEALRGPQALGRPTPRPAPLGAVADPSPPTSAEHAGAAVPAAPPAWVAVFPLPCSLQSEECTGTAWNLTYTSLSLLLQSVRPPKRVTCANKTG